MVRNLLCVAVIPLLCDVRLNHDQLTSGDVVVLFKLAQDQQIHETMPIFLYGGRMASFEKVHCTILHHPSSRQYVLSRQ